MKERTGNRSRIHTWLVAIPLLSLFHPQAHAAVTADQAKTAIDAYNTVFWRQDNKTFYKKADKTGELDYWMWAHAWETEMDAYERTKDPAYLQKIRDCYDGFVAKNSTDLSKREYNDDQGWWVMAATRAYELTGVVDYRDFAKKNFDWMYSHQVDAELGGGIWWKNNEHNQKNSASTLPYSVAGFKLARELGDASYGEKAKSLHAWVKSRLWRPTGEVGDRVEKAGNTVIWGPLSYNHGTFISSSWEAFKLTGDSTYFRDALATMEYFRTVKCDKTTGIFPDERGDGTGNTDNDAGMYKTVFVHYGMRFIIEAKQWQFLPWMNTNAESIWKYRRQSDNLCYFMWATPAPTAKADIGGQMATGGPALMNLVVLANDMQAQYSEGTDTTNAQGQGLGNAFTVTATGISGNGNKIAFYHFTKAGPADGFRLFNHSFQDIQKAPSDFTGISTDAYTGADILNHAFALKLTDSTYAKVVLLKKVDTRYLYRWGISKVRNKLTLVQSDYSKSPRYKVNNFQIQPSAISPTAANTVSNFKWETPVDNNHRLTGYEIYAINVAKADTTKPVNLADWTLLAATAQANLTWTRVGDDLDKYLNVVAVYDTGKSAPLDGWVSITNEKKVVVAADAHPKGEFSLTVSGDDIVYSVPERGHLSLTLYNSSGRFVQSLFAGFRNPGRFTLALPKAGIGSESYFLKIGYADREMLKRFTPLK